MWAFLALLRVFSWALFAKGMLKRVICEMEFLEPLPFNLIAWKRSKSFDCHYNIHAIGNKTSGSIAVLRNDSMKVDCISFENEYKVKCLI